MPPSITDIHSYRQVEPSLATSGQPDESQLKAIADARYKVIINLALHNDPRYSLSDEAASVAKLGLKYVHIPVEFSAPTDEDLNAFFVALDESRPSKVWVHCAANKRVTAFLGLYLHQREGVSENEAFMLLRDIWEPDHVWSKFIARRLGNGDA